MFGLIRKVKNQIRKADAAAALENLLKTQAEAGNLQGNPHIIANDMITETWDRSKKHVNWQDVSPPHKISLVAISLAERVEKTQYGDPSFFGYNLALGVVLLTANRNHTRFGFSPLDFYLLDAAGETQQRSCDAMALLPVAKEINAFLNEHGK